MKVPMRRLFVVSVLILGTISLSVATESRVASATSGDVFAVGRSYCIDTYSGHPNYFGRSSANWVLDINFPGDRGTPLYAPAAGSVEHVTSSGGWGNSVVWTSADGREKLHLAHLDSVTATGRVAAGTRIGTLGNTGNSFGAHLHISRWANGGPAPVVLSGRTLDSPPIDRADGVYGTCIARNTYISNGPTSDGAGTSTLARNGGFEVGGVWKPWAGTANYANYHNSDRAGEDARNGQRYGATNTAVSGGGIYQDVAVSASAGDLFCASAWVRTQAPQTGSSGRFVVWLLGGAYNENGAASFSNLGNGTSWRKVETCVAASTNQNTMRIQFYPTPGAPTLQIDDVAVHGG